MRLLSFAALLSLSTALKCPGISFNYRCYDVDILKDGVSNIHQMVLNDNDDTLYFTFDQIATIPSRGLAFLNLYDKTSGIIDGIRNATGVAVDKKRNRVYVGGADGLFFLHENKVPEKLPVHYNIQYLFHKDVVYFVNNRRQAFKFDYGTVVAVPELQHQEVDKFILDDADNILFLQNEQLFRVKLGTRAINIHERYRVNVLTTDYNYKPYVSATNGVFVYNKYKYALDRVASIVDLRQLIFTKRGDPIYVVLDYIVMLQYNPTP